MKVAARFTEICTRCLRNALTGKIGLLGNECQHTTGEHVHWIVATNIPLPEPMGVLPELRDQRVNGGSIDDHCTTRAQGFKVSRSQSYLERRHNGV